MLQKQEHLASLRGTLSSGKNIKIKVLISLEINVGAYLPRAHGGEEAGGKVSAEK